MQMAETVMQLTQEHQLSYFYQEHTNPLVC